MYEKNIEFKISDEQNSMKLGNSLQNLQSHLSHA